MTSSNAERKFPRILLIDDDSISREVLAAVLEIYGFAVDSAEDGEGALALIAEAGTDSTPELILMDTQMPGLSGLELVVALRRTTQARIVAISGSEVDNALREATDGFLLKPIQGEDLAALLGSRSVESRSAGQEVSPPPDTSEAIDPEVLRKLKAMMPPAAVTEIYLSVAADLETRLVALGAAMDAENLAEVRRIAHSIKGGSAMVGLSGAARSASRLENSNRSETWQKELLQLHSLLSTLQSILNNGLL